ncbi:MAG TPA: MFS transporter [Vicinamibacterales bacterium]|nr:MFS transporter [Vicinamibacterales bacterium]
MKKGAVSRDAALIYIAAFLRSSTVGLVGVVLAIYLGETGLAPIAIGFVIGAGLAGGAIATVLVGLYGDAFGRKRSLIALGVLTMLGYAAVAIASNVAAIMAAALFGMLNGMGRDRGAASALDQAVLPATATQEQRTWVLAWYNVVLDGGHAIGALAGAIPTLLTRVVHVTLIEAHRVTFWLCGAAMLVGTVSYFALTRQVESESGGPALAKSSRLSPNSKRAVTRLAMLFGVDSIGGGFLNSALIAYWFFQRYGTSETQLAVLFFTARVLNAASHVAAAWLARRIGLVNTMVFTHLPSSLFLMAAPAAPTAGLASALFLAREALVEMDVPTRQSYVMAIVRPSERTFASGVTNVTRNVSWAIGPSVAGFVMQRVALAGPLFIGGTLKIAYDVMLYAQFRHVRPPEEQSLHTTSVS